MDITTKFNLADVAYISNDARDGKMIQVIIEKIKINIINPDLAEIVYQIGSNEKFHKSEVYESDLLTYSEAKEIAETELEEEKDEIQRRIDDL